LKEKNDAHRTARVTAQASPVTSIPPDFEQLYRFLETPLYDLMRMIKAADFLLTNGLADMESEARLLVETASDMAHDLYEAYQNDFPGNQRTGQTEGISEEVAS
jgi:hypothetical protein